MASDRHRTAGGTAGCLGPASGELTVGDGGPAGDGGAVRLSRVADAVGGTVRVADAVGGTVRVADAAGEAVGAVGLAVRVAGAAVGAHGVGVPAGAV
ncbi:hypothetical protein [Micromonospora sp. NPDC047527]|uniref:hypothetical protein n=1 Tax=unclassified Micromonospora TaxID=2617518 RepID=UPI0034086761